MRIFCCLVLFGLSLNGFAACAVKNHDIIGAWQYVSGDGFFEEFDIEESSRFNSWLHQRPEIVDASWQLKGCKLTISSQSSLNFVYRVKLKKDILTLTETIGVQANTSTYKRLK